MVKEWIEVLALFSIFIRNLLAIFPYICDLVMIYPRSARLCSRILVENLDTIITWLLCLYESDQFVVELYGERHNHYQHDYYFYINVWRLV